MSVVIKNGLMKYKDGDGNYVGINAVSDQTTSQQLASITNEGTTQVGKVNSAGTTQVGKVQAKGDQVIASIPEDYSELSSDVTSLKSALSDSANLNVPLSTMFTLVQGDLNQDATVDSTKKYRACTNGIQTLSRKVLFTVKSGFRMLIDYYNNGTYYRNSGWITTSIEAEGDIGFVVGKTPESTSAEIEPSELEKGILIDSNMGADARNAITVINMDTEHTNNLASFYESVATVNGVTIKTHKNCTVEFNGTCTSGGAAWYRTGEFTLKAGGPYRIYTYYSRTEHPNTYGIVYNAITGTSISSGQFTLQADTRVYVAFQLVNGAVYNDIMSIVISEGTAQPIYKPPYTAIDYTARQNFADYVKVVSEDYSTKHPLKVDVFSLQNWQQGACCVNGKTIGFWSGSDDHTEYGAYKIADLLSSETITMQHNLGHAASADYNHKTDTMLVGNGSTSTSNLPVLYLVKNIQALMASPSNILYNGDNVTSIDISDIGGYGACACFGETESICYVMTQGENNKYIYKCLLGLGSNDMTTIYADDSYGTFKSGCDTYEYNGTLHVLNTYVCASNMTGELQGLKYLNGKIILPTDKRVSSVLYAYITIVALQEDGSAIAEKNLWIPRMDNSGAIADTEAEDVVFYNGVGYVVTRSVINNTNVFTTEKFTLDLY